MYWWFVCLCGLGFGLFLLCFFRLFALFVWFFAYFFVCLVFWGLFGCFYLMWSMCLVDCFGCGAWLVFVGLVICD